MAFQRGIVLAVIVTLLLVCIRATITENEVEDSDILRPADRFRSEIKADDKTKNKPKVSSKEVYANLKKSIESVRKSCGQVCDTSVTGTPGKYYDVIEKTVDCDALFSNPDIDAPGEFCDAPKKPPKWLAPEYTYGDRVPFKYWYIDDTDGINMYTNWSMDLLTYLTERYHLDNMRSPYGEEAVQMIKNFTLTYLDVKDKHVLVYGSQSPWIEVILLEAGARKITSIDYMEITSEHERIETMTAWDMADKFIKRTLPKFDVMVTFSSLEHSGLGRYFLQ